MGTPMARMIAQAKAPSGTTISGPISVGPLGVSAVSGYRKLYLRSFAQRTRSVDGSVVGPDRLTRDRQPKPCASGFVGDVRLPDRAESLRGNALAFIGNGDAHRVAPTEFCNAGLHRDAAVLSRGIDRVEEHVTQRARQRSVVTVYPGKILVYLEIESNAGRHTATRSVTNELSHVDFRRRTFGQLPKFGEAPRHAIETLRFHRDDIDVILQRLRRLSAQASKREADRRQRILDLVRDSSCALPECVEALRLDRLTSAVLELRHHFAHASSQRLELRRAPYSAGRDLDGRAALAIFAGTARDDGTLGRRRQGLTMTNELGPADQLVQRPAQLSA